MNKTILFLCSVILILGCDDSPKAKKVRLKPYHSSTTSTKYHQDNTVKIAIAPVISPKVSLVLYWDLIEYLRKKSGMNIELIQRGTYGEINELIRNGDCDIAFICTGAYIRAKYSFPLDVLVVPLVDGISTYNSYVIVAKDSKITKFEELRNKNFAFCDLLSLTGYFYVKHKLNNSNSSPDKFFSSFIFTGSHDNSIESVAGKITDAAAVSSIVYEILLKQKNPAVLKTKIIEKSHDFGAPPIVVRNNIDNEVKRKFRNIFLDMHNNDEGRMVLNKIYIEKFMVPGGEIYNSTETLFKEIGVVK